MAKKTHKVRQKKHTASLKVRERRQRVKRAYAKGLTQDEIASLENICRDTVVSDLDAIKVEITRAIEKKDMAQIMLLVQSNHDATLRELWKLYVEAKQENTKLGCMKQINALISDTISVYQRLGLLDKAAEKFEISGVELVVNYPNGFKPKEKNK